LQRARARLERAILVDSSKKTERRELLINAIGLLEDAIPKGKGNNEKHEGERKKLLARCHGLIDTIRPVRSHSHDLQVIYTVKEGV
jgi:hypothetical protein